MSTENYKNMETTIRTVSTAVMVAVLLWVGNNTHKATIALVGIEKDITHVVQRVDQLDVRFTNISSRLRTVEDRNR